MAFFTWQPCFSAAQPNSRHTNPISVSLTSSSQYQIGQAVRDDGPQTHLSKAGTPTMGGALILVSIAISTLLWADLTNRYVWVTLLVTLMFGAVGWVDDYRKVVERNPRGLPARWKYFWQSVDY